MIEGGDFLVLALGIDPGSDKCGLAVVSVDNIMTKKVVIRKNFIAVVKQLVKEYNVDVAVLGDGTGSRLFFRELQESVPNLRVVTIDEQHSTEEARTRYWLDHRPRGWRSLLPTTMQLPPEPYDDYVAVILAQRYLVQERP